MKFELIPVAVGGVLLAALVLKLDPRYIKIALFLAAAGGLVWLFW